MRPERSPQSLPPVIVLFGLVFLPFLFFHHRSEGSIRVGTGSEQKGDAVLLEQKRASLGLPVRLRIPSIGVDTPFEYVGLTKSGAIGVPKERSNVAWFTHGPHPGESGTAIVVGHYGWGNKKSSVFDNLHKLGKGDKLYIEDEEGETTTFVVRESRKYDKHEDPPELFGLADGRSYLNLITCDGEWDATSKTYSQRLVVFTEKE